jgi:hypothetical protein
MPAGLSPNAAMTQGEVGAKLYVPACGPEATLMLAVLPSAALCGSAGVATSARKVPETMAAKMRGVFTVT